jgi:hypothetical protein
VVNAVAEHCAQRRVQRRTPGIGRKRHPGNAEADEHGSNGDR